MINQVLYCYTKIRLLFFLNSFFSLLSFFLFVNYIHSKFLLSFVFYRRGRIYQYMVFYFNFDSYKAFKQHESHNIETGRSCQKTAFL